MHPQEQFNQIIESLSDLRERLSELNKYRFAEQFIDTHELMKMLGISKRTAQKWRETGLIPYAQLGKKIYYRLSDIEKMFEEQFKATLNHKKFNSPARKLKLPPRKTGNGWEISIGNSRLESSEY